MVLGKSVWEYLKADELAQSRDEVNRENRHAIRALAIAGIPLSLANMVAQLVLSTETDLVAFFMRTSWVFLYFAVLLILERKVIPSDYPHATALLYVIEIPVMVCSILLGSVWDPNNQAVTFFLFLMAIPAFMLDRPIRVMLVLTGWVVLFLGACYLVKPPDIFGHDGVHAIEFLLASMAVANVVIDTRMVGIERLNQVNYNLEHDDLTGMRNGTSLERDAQDWLDMPVTIAIAQIEQFSMYNDFYGYQVGNRLLVEFAAIISSAFGDRCSYRYSNDEMLCVFGGSREQECLQKMEECRNKLRMCPIDDLKILPTCSVGYATGVPHTVEEFQRMVQLADIYVHKAASGGKGRTFGGAFDEESLRKAIVESNLETHVRAHETNDLTGLPSMAFFISRADEMLMSIVDMSRDPMVGYFDIANMKAYNSEHGYAQGDELIRHTAQFLREAFPNRLLCCISGCQFAIMCYKDEVGPGMQAVTQRLHDYCAGRSVVCKAGFADHDSHEKTISCLDKARVAERSIQDEADMLYRYYDEQLDADVKFSEYLVSHLDEAIEHGYLEVYYQPIVRTATREVCDEEALSRWNDPVHGMLMPFRFIPPLEESRQVYKLSLHVVRQVLKDFDRKKSEGVPIVPVSVNLSRHDFEQCDMVAAITELVDESRYPRDMLRIEITESAFMKNQELLKREVARFRECGFQVWMDDFGSEYSTLNLLQNIDVDLMKIDMEFMRSTSDSGKNLIIVSSLIDMAKRMGVASLVEGVETEEHLGILRAMGCDKLQGYLFSKPRSLDDVLRCVQGSESLPFEQ